MKPLLCQGKWICEEVGAGKRVLSRDYSQHVGATCCMVSSCHVVRLDHETIILIHLRSPCLLSHSLGRGDTRHQSESLAVSSTVGH